MKKIFLLLFLITLPAQAFQDCVIFNDGKLSDISIEKNDIIDVYPLITVMNEKNTLMVHPLKEGVTRFCVLKNGKDKFMFNVEVRQDETIISENDGFDIFPVDEPPEVFDYELDLPPKMSGEN